MTQRTARGLVRVAAEAGVSIATVSNTINRPELVSPSTRERVHAAMERLEFVPNRTAAALRAGSSRLLGLVVPEVVNPFYGALVEAIASDASARGYAVQLCVSHDDPDVELEQFAMLAEHRAAAAVVVPLSATAQRLRRLRLVGTRLVLLDRIDPAHDGCAVAVDDVAGGALAAGHALAAAGSGLTLVNGPLDIPQCADRRTGALRALSDGVLREFTSGAMSVEGGVAIGRAIADGDAPRRVFCTNDQLAVGVSRGLRERGLSVPDDVRIVGYGDLALAPDAAVPLTTVAQPLREMGARAVSAAIADIEASPDHVHETSLLTPTLVLRASAP